MRAARHPSWNIASVLRLMGAFVAVALAVSACRATGAAGPTPATFTGIADSLGQQGIEISNVVSGETGCNDPTLVPAAISFDARGVDQAIPTRIHLFTFGNGAAYDRLNAEVTSCARSFGAGYTRVDHSPYVAAGPGTWPPGFKQGVESALAGAIPVGP